MCSLHEMDHGAKFTQVKNHASQATKFQTVVLLKFDPFCFPIILSLEKKQLIPLYQNITVLSLYNLM